MAPNTWRTYSAAWKSYHTFTRQAGLISLPLSPAVLQLYVTQASGHLRFATIKVYIAALKFINTFHGFDSSFVFTEQLHYLLRGVRRTQAITFTPTPPRIPISPAHILLLFRHVDAAYSTLDSRCFRAAFTLAFFGLLRVSEFTCPSPYTFDASYHLSPTDVSFSHNPTIMHIHIKQSKTDPFRLGCTIRLAQTNNALCPIRAMLQFLALRPPVPGPLFLFHDGSFLSYSDIRDVLSHTFPFSTPGTMGTHSFRIGGASMLCSLGVPEATVQI